MAQKFAVGDKVRFLVYQDADGLEGNYTEVQEGEEGVIIGIDFTRPYPYSVKVEGKPVAHWDDAAWHMEAHELELAQ